MFAKIYNISLDVAVAEITDRKMLFKILSEI